MKSLNNHFHIRNGILQIVADRGEFTIEDGIINPVSERYLPGQYIRIAGSIFNDGVYSVERIGEGYIDVSLTDVNYPAWMQPTGAVDAYPMGARVSHNGIRYVSIINANVTEPGTGRYWEIVSEIEHLTRNEVFTGAVAPLAVPSDFISLVREIEQFQSTNGNPNSKTYVSQSVGSWSGSRATNDKGMIAGWQDVFAGELNKYRRMWPEVIL